MKRILYIALAAFGMTGVQAQEIGVDDALNYSSEQLTGTARFRAMSGAFGALGGDLSAIMINPAGSVVFANSVVGGSLTNYNSKNTSTYFGTSSKDSHSSFDLNQLGGSWVLKNQDESSKWKKLAISFNYENTNNFDDDFFAYGTNPTNSIASYFTNYANSNGGVALSNLQTMQGESIDDLYAYLGETRGLGFPAQQAFLGYQAYVINPMDDTNPENNTYFSNIPSGGNYYQEYTKQTRGYNGKFSANLAMQYGSKWSFGANINAHFTDYYQWTDFYEDNGNNPQNGVQALRFTNEYTTTGSGVSLQVGTIYKITDAFRAGVSYQSPTWMWLNDKLVQTLQTDYTQGSDQVQGVLVAPDVINIYKTYRLRNPGKWTGSLAYIFGKSGLISADYSLKDYGNSRFSGDSEFSPINSSISNQLGIAGEFRVGAEYRIGLVSIRGGYRNESSPYENGRTIGDLNGFSGGLGFTFGRTKLDFAYSYWQRDFEQQFYQTGLTDSASGTIKNNNITMSLMFDL
ncbi:transporter [Flavobacterium silvaticum]|uniref:Transporter n=1 Tax=Flavobacterium silvaticum TaxID=1852020 RepID=A0A972FNE1_9FLAO|nr:transporter [Flavobacterium silvaticum]NMH29259.1 transporter [Flavobacterium silvaticum]